MLNLDELTTDLSKTRGVGLTRPTEQGDFSLDNAYRVAHRLRAAEHAAGKTLAGRKIGISNRAAWAKLGLDDVVWGYIFDDTVIEAKTNEATLSLTDLSAPRLEPEIIFGLKSALPTGSRDGAELLKHAEWFALGFEIVQNPYPNWAVTPADLVATYGYHGRLTYGEKVFVDKPNELAEALVKTEVKLFKDGELILEGAGTNVVDSPAAALGHLADLIAADEAATPLAAGELITTGTLTGAPDIQAGETYRVSVSGPGLPDFTLHLE